MGHLNDHDPVNTRAITRSRLGLMRETQRFRTGHYPNPARGDTRDYPLWLRTKAINNLDSMGSYCSAALLNGCSTSSVRRWERRILPYRMSGGRQRGQLTGADQLLLNICIFIYPEASLDKIAISFIEMGATYILTHKLRKDVLN